MILRYFSVYLTPMLTLGLRSYKSPNLVLVLQMWENLESNLPVCKMGKILMDFCTLCENFAKISTHTYPETDMSNILPFRQLLNEVDFCCEIKKVTISCTRNLNILYTQLQGDQQFLLVFFKVCIIQLDHICFEKSSSTF